MKNHVHKTFVCSLCNNEKKLTHSIHGSLMKPPISRMLKEKHPHWDPEHHVCLNCVDQIRTDYIQGAIDEETNELSAIAKKIAETEAKTNLLSLDINSQFDKSMKFGDRLADKIAEFGGSWKFIIIFASILIGWIILNTLVLLNRSFDPYPFILLNLVLSSLAAFQAPVIMMSQNRQAAKDRLQAEQDFKVNLKAELEIQHLHAKLDTLLTHQWQRLLEIQQMQIELMENLLEKNK